jgi:hypothetical protein
METEDGGTDRYSATASSPTEVFADLLKTYPNETFKSARHAVHNLKEWLNQALYHSKKPEEAIK